MIVNGRTVEPNRGAGVLVQPTAVATVVGGNDGSRFVLSNLISGNLGDGITIAGARATVVAANQIGTDVGGTIPLGNVVSGNLGSGIEFLGNARGAEVTDTAVGTNYDIQAILPAKAPVALVAGGNLVSDNRAWGLLATGWCRGSKIGVNAIVNNTPGDVNTRAATGLATLADGRTSGPRRRSITAGCTHPASLPLPRG